MTDKKKKQGEDNLQIRHSEDNFANFFIKLCDKYDVIPLPKIVSFGVSDERPETTRHTFTSTDVSAAIIIVTYVNPKIFENPHKFECNGYQVSVCMLDALNVSVKKYQTLTTIRLPNCGINAFGITQIAEILTEVGCVRDLNLDLNPNIRENYYLLCSPLGKLEYLSLKYCNITDIGVETISRELKRNINDKVMPHLIALDLSNNIIQDIGARHIADMLHTNRSLQSLNLTGNRITDVGAFLIIKQLYIYSLTHDEIVELRRMNYRRLKRESKSFNDLSSHERLSEKLSSSFKQKTSRRSISSRKSVNSRQSIGGSYAPVINERESINCHSFSDESQPIEGEIIATGNFELQHLNLSYNHLSDESLKTIADCIFYQNFMIEDTKKGLLHVYLEGNDFRFEENEYWKKFQESLNLRRSSKSKIHEQRYFGTLVSPKAQILREKLRLLEKNVSSSLKIV